jgi:CBS domain containing-hemolysin-like protein
MILAIIIACLLVSFVFSGIEAGIFSVNRVRLAHEVKKRDPAALKLERLIARPDRLLVTVLIVTNFTNICALVLITRELVARFGHEGYWMGLGLYLVVFLIGLELIPKSLFRRFPYRALAALAEPLRIASMLLSPLHFFGEAVQRLFGGSEAGMHQRLYLAREDFKYFAEEGEKSGAISKAEGELISNIVDFRGETAGDVMISLDPNRTLTTETPVSELLRRSAEKQQDRWLVANEGGQIIGVVSAFEVLLAGRRDVNVSAYTRRVVMVGTKEPAYSVLTKLRAARTTVAVVRDATGPVGRLTWDDLIRRLVDAASQFPDATKK